MSIARCIVCLTGLTMLIIMRGAGAVTVSTFKWSVESANSVKIADVSASDGGFGSYPLCGTATTLKRCTLYLASSDTAGITDAKYILSDSTATTHAGAASLINALSGKSISISGASSLANLCPVLYNESSGSKVWSSLCSAGYTEPEDTSITCILGLSSLYLDFGSVTASAFADAGAVNKPDSASQLSDTVTLNCENAASASGTLRLTTANSDGNIFLPSANSKVGFIVKDSSGNMMTPGDSGGIQVNLDSSGQGSLSLLAYPVSVDGTTPDAGSYSATATIVADFN